MIRTKVLAAAERRLQKTCDSLPADVGEDCYREWVAELPAILDDPDVRPALIRWIFVWAFVLDQSRTVSQLQGSSLLDWSRRLIKIFSNPLEIPPWAAALIGLQAGGVFLMIRHVGANTFVAGLVAAMVVLSLVTLRRLSAIKRRRRSPE